MRQVLGGLDPSQVLVDAAWHGRLGVRATSGPAWLSYGESQDVITRGYPHQVDFVSPGDTGLAQLLARVDTAEAGEAGSTGVTSRVAVVRGAAGVVAAAGFQRWAPDSVGDTADEATVFAGGTAHLCVLTAPEVRGRDLAPVVASAAAAEAGRLGPLLHWWARPPASRRVAAAVGLRELGWQLSLDFRR